MADSSLRENILSQASADPFEMLYSSGEREHDEKERFIVCFSLLAIFLCHSVRS
jgi:hypothetical protein